MFTCTRMQCTDALRQGFNRLVRQLLPLLDLGNACRHSLGHRLRGLSHLVLKDVKMAVVEAGKERTQGACCVGSPSFPPGSHLYSVHPPTHTQHWYTLSPHSTSTHPPPTGTGGNALTITLDNFAASRSMEAGEATIRASRCIFVQAYRALHHKDPRLLRSCWDGDRVFQVRKRFKDKTAGTRLLPALHPGLVGTGAWRASMQPFLFHHPDPFRPPKPTTR